MPNEKRRMIVGFTGTRRGMNPWQRYLLENALVSLEVTELHHGDCVGSDAQANVVVQYLGLRTVIHPPTDPKARAFCTYDEAREPCPYLERNHQIVDETDILIAAPEGPEVVRSGTWATIRYARKLNRHVVILERA